MKIILVNEDALPPLHFNGEVRTDFFEQMMYIALLLAFCGVDHVPLFFSFGSCENLSRSQNILNLFFRFGMMRHPGCDHGRDLTHLSTQHTHKDEYGHWYRIVFTKIHALVDDSDPDEIRLQTIRDCVKGQCIVHGIQYQDGVIVILRGSLFSAVNSALSRIPQTQIREPSLPFMHHTGSSSMRNRKSPRLVAIHDLRTYADYRPLSCNTRWTYSAWDVFHIGELCTKCAI